MNSENYLEVWGLLAFIIEDVLIHPKSFLAITRNYLNVFSFRSCVSERTNF